MTHASPKLTIFTAPKSFHGKIGLIQMNAIDSWVALGDDVEVLVIGDEPGSEQAAKSRRLRHIPTVERNDYGTPLISSIFEIARQAATAPMLCYANADIIFLSDLLETTSWISDRYSRYLLVGQRWDLDIDEGVTFGEAREGDLRSLVGLKGKLHKPAGSDYFVFPKDLFVTIPDFALGRSGWDNWMIYRGQAIGALVADATQVVTAIHQNHDYAHLPGGQPHYRLPESERNIELAGGRETLFTLRECRYRLTARGLVRRRPESWRELKRRIVAQAVLAFGPGKIPRLTRALLDPLGTASYFINRSLGRQPVTENEESITSIENID